MWSIFPVYLSHWITQLIKIPFGPHFAIRASFIVRISGEFILDFGKYDLEINYICNIKKFNHFNYFEPRYVTLLASNLYCSFKPYQMCTSGQLNVICIILNPKPL